MEKNSHDSLGDRMKAYEAASTDRYAVKGQPLIARLDGRSFHTYTKGFHRPYDINLSSLMIGLASALVEEFHANVGYVQSDEISLMWYVAEDAVQEYPFAGRFQKLDSVLASFAGAWFNRRSSILKIKEDQLATFDCRSFNVPSKEEALNIFKWRQWDCRKNAVSMAAHTYYSAKFLHGMKRDEMIFLLKDEAHVDFDKYPEFFKDGTFVKKVQVERYLTPEECDKIPLEHQPTGPVMRSEMKTFHVDSGQKEDFEKFIFG